MRKKILLILGLAVIAVSFFLFRESFTRENLETFLGGIGPWGPVVFILIYLVAPALFLPGAPLTIASGVLFGPLWGTVYTIIGATGGATIAFMISRYFGGEWVEKTLSGRLKTIRDGVDREGWKFLAFTRLVPLFPFNLLNYAFGLTRIPLLQYVVVSAVSMLPGAAVYAYLGHAGREAASGGANAVFKVLTAIGLLILISTIPGLVRKMKAANDSR
ncbi:MAG: TVP38/TMEM64 family protein [Nitrospirota bacterium]|nr:TVP38/TMEM64 family protein [Nitrospirota bacterium]